MARTTAGGTRPSIGRPGGSRSRRSVDEMSRRGIDTRSTRHPAPGRLGVGVAGPLHDHDGRRGRGSRRAAATCPCWRPRRRRARGTARGRAPASASSVSAVTDGALALDLDRRRLDAVDTGDRGLDQREPVARPTPRPGRASATGHRRRRAAPGRGRARARVSAATTTWPTCTGSNVPPSTPRRSTAPSSTRESTGAPCLHLGETFASSSPVRIASVSDSAEPVTHVLVRVWLPDRPGALGLVASRIGAVDGDIVGIDVLERGDGVAVDEFAVELRDADRARPPRARDRRGRRRERRGGADRRALPRPPPRRARVGGDARARRVDRRAAARDARRRRSAPSSSPTGARSCSTATVLASARRRRPEAVGARGARPRAPRRRRWSPTAPPGPTTSRSRRSPVHDAALLVGRDGHPFRRRERAQLLALAGIADRTWTLLERLPRPRVRSPHVARRRLHPGPARRPTTRRSPTAAAEADHVVPLFVFDDAILSASFNCPNRTGFLLESLDDLDRALQRLGAPLVIRRGDWVDEVMRRGRATSAPTRSTCSDDVSAYAQHAAALAPCASTRRSDVECPPGRHRRAARRDRPGRLGEHYKVFTPYYRRWLGGAAPCPGARRPAGRRRRPASTPGTLPALAELVERRARRPR